MKRSMLLTIVLLLMASVGYGQMTSDVQETVTAKEKEMYEAIKTGDMQTFEANMADNFTGVYPSGVHNRDQELENIKSLKMDAYELSDIQVTELAEGVASITYTLNASGMWKEEEFSGQYYASSIWVMTDNEWRAVMHTEAQAQPMEETMGMEQ